MEYILKLKKTILKIIKRNNLDGDGERVDILYQNNIDFKKLDMYQKSHFRRYEFAKDYISPGSVCGDFACGTGYGTVMLAEKSQKVIGADLNSRVIEKITKRYENISNTQFINANLLELQYSTIFNTIVSFETIEHFAEVDVTKILKIFHRALNPGGKIIFSTPYMQERSENAIKLGFHLTFYINEEKIKGWLNNSGFSVECFKYQNYQTHSIQEHLDQKDFIIVVAQKN